VSDPHHFGVQDVPLIDLYAVFDDVVEPRGRDDLSWELIELTSVLRPTEAERDCRVKREWRFVFQLLGSPKSTALPSIV
jgi:hypothetical protein